MTTALLDGLTVGEPTTVNGITLYPVTGTQPAPGPIALVGDGVVITEKESAEVPTLVATNPTDSPVLLVEGEVLEGGQQTRTLNVSVLVPANTTIELPVSCVEAGRWRGGRDFVRSDYYASRKVRESKTRGVNRSVRQMPDYKISDQAAVWGSVSRELSDHGATSDTESFEAVRAAVFEADEARRSATAELIEVGPGAGQSGVVVAVGGRVVSAELFGDPDLFAARWDKIVRSIMFDVGTEVAGSTTVADAEEFLRQVAAGEAVPAPGVGLGNEVHVETGELVGQALVWEDSLVHASAFAIEA